MNYSLIILATFTLLFSACNRQTQAESDFRIVNPDGDRNIGTTTGANSKVGGNSSENITRQYTNSLPAVNDTARENSSK